MKIIFVVSSILFLLSACGTPESTGNFNSYYQTSGATRSGDLVIERVELAFAGGLRSITVAKEAPIAVRVNIKFRGQGNFGARWLKDGQVVEQVNLTLHQGSILTLSPRRLQLFSSYQHGQHTIQFEIVQPTVTFITPQIAYFVTAAKP